MSTAPSISVYCDVDKPNSTFTSDDLAAFLRQLFGDQTGWLPIKYGAASAGEPRRFDQVDWYAYPAQLGEVATDALFLGHEGYDVGYSVSLFPSKRIGLDEALPGAFLYADDLPLDQTPLAPSLIVRTSEQKPPQAIILLDRPIPAKERQRLSRAWATAAGADLSGADVTQVLRLPGTYNYKHDERYPVSLEWGGGRVYNLDEVTQTSLSSDMSIPGPETNAVAIDWRDVERERGRIEDILLRIKPHTVTYKRLHGEKMVARDDGEPDTSATRFAVASDLRKRYGLPDVEIAALLLHFDWDTEKRKGRRWLENDILRCMSAAHDRYPDANVTPTHGGTPGAARRPSHSGRAERGRPSKLTADAYLAHLLAMCDEDGFVWHTQTEMADQLGVSLSTIQRVERKLKERDEIGRCAEREEHPSTSFLTVNSAIKNSDKPDPPYPIIDDTEKRIGMRNSHNRSWNKGKHTPIRAPKRGTKRAIVGEAMDAIRDGLSLKRVQWYIDNNYPNAKMSDNEIKEFYRQERDRRRTQRKRADLSARIKRMSIRELRGAMKGAERHIAKSHERGDQGWKYWSWWRNECEAEIKRRSRDGSARAKT